MGKRTKNCFMATLIGFFISIDFIHASAQVFQYRDEKFSLPLHQSWQAKKNIYGLPWMFFAPKKNNFRSSLSVTPTGWHDVKFHHRNIARQHEDYVQGRKKYLKLRKGKLLNMRPYRVTKGAHKEFHEFGYDYQIGQEKFQERSVYLLCRGKLFHLKSVTLFDNKNEQQSINALVRGFECPLK